MSQSQSYRERAPKGHVCVKRVQTGVNKCSKKHRKGSKKHRTAQCKTSTEAGGRRETMKQWSSAS
eukprot:365293-Chlamydomonas_euryale.AAC.10